MKLGVAQQRVINYFQGIGQSFTLIEINTLKVKVAFPEIWRFRNGYYTFGIAKLKSD